MARFRGTVQGGRGMASRLGHATSGLAVTAQSWVGEVTVQCFVEDERDWVRVVHVLRDGTRRTLYEGRMDGEPDATTRRAIGALA